MPSSTIALLRGGANHRTLGNIREARRRGIPIRVGVIGMNEKQHVDLAVEELRELGIAQIGVDYLRQVGRGAGGSRPDVSQLCGRCVDGSLAVSPSGEVWPCVFSRWLPVGNVQRSSLGEINRAAGDVRADLRAEFGRRGWWPPTACDPDCRPCEPNCSPKYECDPQKGNGDPHGCPSKKQCHPWE
jgi:MoaA/NifB/PqqE/SkfB family radical SAM enzyme